MSAIPGLVWTCVSFKGAKVHSSREDSEKGITTLEFNVRCRTEEENEALSMLFPNLREQAEMLLIKEIVLQSILER